MGTLTVLHGGNAPAVNAWEADLEQAVADLIHTHIRATPAPGPSQVADDLTMWADQLTYDAATRGRRTA
jgi:hypothetical protein